MKHLQRSPSKGFLFVYGALLILAAFLLYVSHTLLEDEVSIEGRLLNYDGSRARFIVCFKKISGEPQEFYLSSRTNGLPLARLSGIVKGSHGERQVKYVPSDADITGSGFPILDQPFDHSYEQGVYTHFKPGDCIYNTVDVIGMEKGLNEVVFVLDNKFKSSPVKVLVD